MLLPGAGVPQRREVRLGGEVGEDDGALEGRHGRLQLGHHRATVEVLAAVAVAVDREEHLGLDLGEAVDHAGRAEVGRAAGPDGSDRGRGEEGDDGLRDVGQVGDDTVAGTDSEGAQAGGGCRYLGPQLAPAHLTQLTQLRGMEDRRLRVVLAGEDVLRVIDLRAGEPPGAGHLVAREDALGLAIRLHVEELPDRGPEPLEVVDRPPPERVVAVEGESPLGLEPAHVFGHARSLDQLGRRRPGLFGRAPAHSRIAAAPLSARACSRSSSIGSWPQKSRI